MQNTLGTLAGIVLAGTFCILTDHAQLSTSSLQRPTPEEQLHTACFALALSKPTICISSGVFARSTPSVLLLCNCSRPQIYHPLEMPPSIPANCQPTGHVHPKTIPAKHTYNTTPNLLICQSCKKM